VSINQATLDEFLGRFVSDLGATFHAANVVIGDKLGLYKALAGAGPCSSADLAERTRTTERYVREWLRGQAAGGYVTYVPATDRYLLTEEQAFALAQEDSPAFVPGAFQMATSTVKDEAKIAEVFRTGVGVGWHEHHRDLFQGTERFFRTRYIANLVDSWLPALDGVTAKLEAGARAADVGCGHGASTIILAQAYPNSIFVGFDYHEPSIEVAREAAAKAGVGRQCTFEVARAQDFPGMGYDLVAFFDCLHDMGDPVGAAAHVLQALDENGTWMIVEPFAKDRVEDNLNPVGRVFYNASTLICTPASASQEVGLCLGAQAGEAALRDVVLSGGFTRFKRATETPFNLILEAKP